MDLWEARTESQNWLEDDLSQEAELIGRGFLLIGKCLEAFDKANQTEKASLNGRFARICGLTLAKARNLALGCYSLSMDALAQEAGALLRPLIETYELLVYFRLDPTRVDQAIDGTLPSAGKIGRVISGQFQSLREHLNKNASHFGFEYDALKHLVDNQTFKPRPVPIHGIKTFRTNLTMVSAYLTFVLLEGISCLFSIGINAENLADRAEAWRDECSKILTNSVNAG